MPDDLRAIDAEIAERLFGWDHTYPTLVPPYSSSCDAEALVIEAMAKREWDCRRDYRGVHLTRFSKNDTDGVLRDHIEQGTGSTSPLATVRAALAALKSEEPTRYAASSSSSSTVSSTDPPAAPLTDEEREPPYRGKP